MNNSTGAPTRVQNTGGLIVEREYLGKCTVREALMRIVAAKLRAQHAGSERALSPGERDRNGA